MAELVRIQKFIASAAIASRREAEQMILQGRVAVNGERITELGRKIDPDVDVVTIDGKPIMAEPEKIYVLFYKPQYCLTTKHDPQGRRTIYDVLKGLPDHIAYVGRLDWDAEGALILTNDGDFIHKLTHPSHKVPKTYEVKVKGLPDNEALDKLRRGIRLKDGKTAPADVEVILITEKGNAWLRIVIYEGRKNQIKRMINAIGYKVVRLVRTHIGDVFIGDLMSTQWRYLSDAEVESLKNYKPSKDSIPKGGQKFSSPPKAVYSTGKKYNRNKKSHKGDKKPEKKSVGKRFEKKTTVSSKSKRSSSNRSSSKTKRGRKR